MRPYMAIRCMAGRPTHLIVLMVIGFPGRRRRLNTHIYNVPEKH